MSHFPPPPSTRTTVKSSAPLTSSYAATDSLDVSSPEREWVDFMIHLTGSGATLASVLVKIEYSVLDAPSTDADWGQLPKEEFTSSSGSGTHYPAELTRAVTGAQVNAGHVVPITVRRRGKWMRIQFKGDATIAGTVTRVVYAYARSL